MLLLLPHCLASWVAASPGWRGSVKRCMIRRGRVGLGWGQKERARGTGGEEIRTPIPTATSSLCCSPSASFLPPPHQGTSLLHSHCCPEPPELGTHCRHTGWDMGPSHRFKLTGLCACTCSFVHRLWRGERKVSASFSQALHCASPHWQLCQGGGEVGSQERRL